MVGDNNKNSQGNSGDQMNGDDPDMPIVLKEVPGIEELFQEQGGVKLIQPISLIIIWFQIASGNWMNYQFSFLLKYPVF